jgi:recombination protein RecA
MSEDWLSKFEEKQIQKPKRVGEQKVISTSYMQIDDALGVHGLPLGKVIDLAGEPGSGKTSVALDIISSFQERNLSCVYLDLERAFDADFAYLRRVNCEDLLLFRPEKIDGIAEAGVTLMEQGLADLIVFDTISAIPLDGITLKDILNPLLQNLVKYDSSLLLLSQIRNDLAQGGITTPSNSIIDDVSNIRIMLRKKSIIKHLDVIIGHKVEVDIYKNDLATPAKTEIELFI